jgi:prepilin-type N-terminal cleavage/methylation domain-containing protein
VTGKPKKIPKSFSSYGFTLLELLLVLTLLSLLAGLAAPVVTTAITRAQEAALRENLQIMRHALDDYYADNGRYPDQLEVLVERRYLRFIPKDPVQGDADSWATETSETEEGVDNVLSSSSDTALDGSYYSEW